MSTLVRNSLMKTQNERIVDLEKKVEKLENDYDILAYLLEEKNGCACGGQNCGPTYQQTKD